MPAILTVRFVFIEYKKVTRITKDTKIELIGAIKQKMVLACFPSLDVSDERK